MSQGSKKPLVQLCLAFQVQSPPIGVACYGAAPGRGGGGQGCYWVGKPHVQPLALLRASVLGLERAWLAHPQPGRPGPEPCGRGKSLWARTGNFGSSKASPSPQGTVPKMPPSRLQSLGEDLSSLASLPMSC